MEDTLLLSSFSYSFTLPAKGEEKKKKNTPQISSVHEHGKY